MDDRVKKAAEELAAAAHDVIQAQTDFDEVHANLRDAVVEFDKAVAATALHVAQ